MNADYGYEITDSPDGKLITITIDHGRPGLSKIFGFAWTSTIFLTVFMVVSASFTMVIPEKSSGLFFIIPVLFIPLIAASATIRMLRNRKEKKRLERRPQIFLSRNEMKFGAASYAKKDVKNIRYIEPEAGYISTTSYNAGLTLSPYRDATAGEMNARLGAVRSWQARNWSVVFWFGAKDVVAAKGLTEPAAAALAGEIAAWAKA